LDVTRISGPGEQPVPTRRRSTTFQLAAVALTIFSAIAGTGLARLLRAPEAEAKAVKFPNRVFEKWKKPDLVLVVTGQQKGYLLPCGCSKPQIGGLERRYNLLEMIKEAGWPYAAVDLGDVAQRVAPAGLPNEQGLIKYRYSMKALKDMGYSAVGFGVNEVNLGLFNVLTEYALNEPKPRVVAGNLLDADQKFPMMTEPWEIAQPAGTTIKVGTTCIVGPTVIGEMKNLAQGNAALNFEKKTTDAIDRILKDMGTKKVDLPVMLYQGLVCGNNMKPPHTEAMALAERYPQFPVVVALSEEDEAPSRPVVVKHKTGGETMIVSLGRKGKFIGVIGVYKTGNAARPFRFEYERVELTEDFVTPEAKEKGHPIMEMMEAYTRELKGDGKENSYLMKHGRVRHTLQVMPAVKDLKNPVVGDVSYAGSEACKKCHPAAFAIWKETPHSKAYKTLVKAEKPANRQYDPECIICHTVGFGIVSGFVTELKTPTLKDVGCESCHGPASAHVANPHNAEWQKRINPWRHLPANKREDSMDQMCQKCHDIDNDVNWSPNGFKKKWPKIAHPTPKDE
jgi:hypothetical protein